MGKSILTPTQRYAAGALLGLALYQAQIHQTRPLGSILHEDEEPTDERGSSCSSSSDSISEDPDLWVHDHSGLLRPVFRFLEIDSQAWSGLEETTASSHVSHHVGAFLRLLSEESDGDSSESMDQEVALTKAVDAMMMSIESSPVSSEASREKNREYENECREKISTGEKQLSSEPANMPAENLSNTCTRKLETPDGPERICNEKPKEEGLLLSYQRKVAVLYELLSACVADTPEDDKKRSRVRKGYDARHRVALRLLGTWLDVKWTKMEAMEIMVACSAMALAKDGEAQKEQAKASESSWAKWKRGGIIGAAALTGGTLLAITGGLAAPAIAAGFGALAPTLGTLVPVIGASGFAAAATAAGSVAGSVAVAASFGAAGAGLTGSKMARRIGNVDEFEFKVVGENHQQGRLAVGIMISGFVFEENDFVKPWEGLDDKLERYALQWESKNLIAVSTAIQDWLTEKLALHMMKQGAMMTVLSTLLVALAWPATLLAATEFIDSKWTIAVDRSDKAGKMLAEVLVKGLQGNRPVTLIGFSLGARVVFKCLQCLAENKDNVGIVEKVVLLGAPIPIQNENWETARKMVAGRFINAYSTNDWILGIAFRASLLTKGLAGIQPVNVPGIENVDVTELIEGHSSYLWATQQILEHLELDTYYPVFRSSSAKSEEERSRDI
ncbi:transmembrane and coiled-coil domain-containing protein 4-like [Telopea speciosissima]|uniref:transmembrane and coiled-coil domain-containing protein 4-like n=1 Tax=Telopea speciosissima TaxID=54955 RepID=UPI001CC54122|nr:transmembrane and coiled-coil domain-containing protein 4-like [Telopea speciosissima]